MPGTCSAVMDGYGKAGAVSSRHDEAAQPFSMCTCWAAEHGNPSWAERTERDCDLASGRSVCERIPEEEPWRKQEDTVGKAISAGREQRERAAGWMAHQEPLAIRRRDDLGS